MRVTRGLKAYRTIGRAIALRQRPSVGRITQGVAVWGAFYRLTRALERGGQILPSPRVFCEYLSKYSFDRLDFFNTCPKINGAPFGAKIEDSSIFGGLFLSPQSQHFRFSPS